MSGISRPDLLFFAGLELLIWVDMFKQSHIKTSQGLNRISWPDGGSYNEQPNTIVSMFNLLTEVYYSLQDTK